MRCWLLHRYPYRRTSAIWELLAESGERIAVVARGVRSPTRRKGAAPGPCSRLLLWCRGNGDLRQLQRFELEFVPLLRGRSLLYVLAANELLMRSTRRLEPNPQLPSCYQRFLDEIAAIRLEEGGHERVYLRFQLSLLQAVGYGLDLRLDVDGISLQPERHYRLNADFRPRLSPDGMGCRGAALLSLECLEIDGEEALQIAREVVQRQLKMAVHGRMQGDQLISSR